MNTRASIYLLLASFLLIFLLSSCVAEHGSESSEKEYLNAVEFLARIVKRFAPELEIPYHWDADALAAAFAVQHEISQSNEHLHMRRILSHSESNGKISMVMLFEDEILGLESRYQIILNRSSEEFFIESVEHLQCEYAAPAKSKLLGIPIPPGNTSINTLLNFFNDTVCKKQEIFGEKVCERGTVYVAPWLSNALATQRFVQRDNPLNFVQFLGTHNSFNDRADGYGLDDVFLDFLLHLIDPHAFFVWAQQEYTMTDQLNMGIRELHLDSQWFMGEIRLCHGGDSLPWLNDFIAELEKVLNHTIDFNSDQLGCTPLDRTYQAGLTEVLAWMNQSENSNEFLFIHHDDDIDYTYNHSVLPFYIATFGSLIFTPEDYTELGYWPSISQLLSMGKRLIVQSQSTYGAFGGNVIFPPFLEPTWPNDCVKYLTEWPDCAGFTPGEWSVYGSESQIIGKIYDGEAVCGLIAPENYNDILMCSINIVEGDQMSPELISYAVWSWGESEPVLTSDYCVALNYSDLRWHTLPCSTSLPYACQLQGNPLKWMIEATPSSYYDTACPGSHNFTYPTSPYQNQVIVSLVEQNQFDAVWIALDSEILSAV